jgi:hypothetical protein
MLFFECRECRSLVGEDVADESEIMWTIWSQSHSRLYICPVRTDHIAIVILSGSLLGDIALNA